MADLKSGSAGGKPVRDPDLSDIAQVIVNVETREGKQYSMIIGCETADQHMSANVRHSLLTKDDAPTGEDEWVFTITRK